MKGFIRVWQDVVLAAVRVVLGGVVLLQGWQRWQVQGIDNQIAQLEGLGVPQPTVFAWAVTMLELVGGVLLVFGVLTPAVAGLFVVASVLSLVWVHPPFAPPPAAETVGGSWEQVALLGALALVLAGFGAGRGSIDQLFRRPEGEDEELRYDETRPG